MLMDEPFSAVDPVVRDELQDEFLRLQSELGKTIVFVTHDIDEAVKLGDQVAVLRVGGKLAQFDDPPHLLAQPADDFVAEFVGRDRGYRALGFTSPRVPLGSELTTSWLGGRRRPPTGGSSSTARAGRRAGSSRARRASTVPAHVVPGGRCTRRVETDRCAARSTPRCRRRAGQGVTVDESVAGSIAADDVLRALEGAAQAAEIGGPSATPPTGPRRGGLSLRGRCRVGLDSPQLAHGARPRVARDHVCCRSCR